MLFKSQNYITTSRENVSSTPSPPPIIHLVLNLTRSFPKSVSQTAATTLILSSSSVFLVNVNLTRIFKRSRPLLHHRNSVLKLQLFYILKLLKLLEKIIWQCDGPMRLDCSVKTCTRASRQSFESLQGRKLLMKLQNKSRFNYFFPRGFDLKPKKVKNHKVSKPKDVKFACIPKLTSSSNI